MPAAVVIALSSAFVLFALVAFSAGRTATFSRRAGVALGTAALGLVPFVAGWLASMLRMRGRPEDLAIAVFCDGLVGWALFTRYVTTPGARRRGAFPSLTDPAILARVAEIAGGLGSAPPRLLRLPSTGALPALAFAGGLASPTLIVADGVLVRLKPSERDAVLGHEIAHVATGTLWLLAGSWTIAATLGAVVTVAVSPACGFCLMLAVGLGLRRVLGRHVEVACDVASGRVVGFAEMAGALDKVHATIALPPGRAADFFYSIASHPPQVVRRAALAHAAAAAGKASIVDVDVAAAHRAHRLAARSLAAWIALLLAGIVLCATGHGWPGTGLLLLLFVAPPFAPLVLFPSVYLRRWRRSGGWRRRWRSVVALVVIAAALIAGVIGGGYMPPPFGPVVVIVLLTLAAFGLRDRNARYRRAVLLAIRDRRYGDAIAVAARRPKSLRTDPVFAHDVALARALSGDRAGGGQALEEAAARWPWFPQIPLTAAVVLGGVDPARAAECARKAAAKLPGDPSPAVLLARALRKMGRIADAQAEVERAAARSPRDGAAHAEAATLAVARGDFAAAHARLADAERYAPGDAAVALAAATLAVAEHAPDLEAAIAEAEKAASGNPFAFLEGDVAALRASVSPAARAPSSAPGSAASS